MNIFTWTPLEIAANVMTAICIFLAGRNSVHTWWTGIVSSVLYGVMFFNAQLYADTTLQAFFIVTGVMGWMAWKKRTDAVLNVSNANPLQVMCYISFALVVGTVYAVILHRYTDAYMPWVDSAVLVFSVVAQFLLMRKQIETWIVWFVVNSLSVPLFWSRELYLTSIMYGFFWVNAIVSYIHWKKIQKEQTV
jgi:nicotinamide mononucleotide transporter